MPELTDNEKIIELISYAQQINHCTRYDLLVLQIVVEIYAKEFENMSKSAIDKFFKDNTIVKDTDRGLFVLESEITQSA